MLITLASLDALKTQETSVTLVVYVIALYVPSMILDVVLSDRLVTDVCEVIAEWEFDGDTGEDEIVDDIERAGAVKDNERESLKQHNA